MANNDLTSIPDNPFAVPNPVTLPSPENFGPIFVGRPVAPFIDARTGGDIFPDKAPAPTTDTFDAIRDRLNQPNQIAPLPSIPEAGKLALAEFEKGVSAISPDAGVRPEIQQALDVLRQNAERTKATNISQAEALAGRRGLQGSSIEQFGVAEAGAASDLATRTSESELLLKNIDAQRFEAQAFFDRANRIDQIGSNQEIARLQAEANRGNRQAELELQRRLAEAGLSADELNTQRNIDLQLQQLEVERILGERALAINEENIRQAEEIARRMSRDQLITNIIGSFGPSILFGNQGILKGGGGGIFKPLVSAGVGAVQKGISGLQGIGRNLFGGGPNISPGSTGLSGNLSLLPSGGIEPGGLGASGTNLPSFEGAGGGTAGAAGVGTSGAAGTGATGTGTRASFSAGLGRFGAGALNLGAGFAGSALGRQAFSATQKSDALGSNLGSAIFGTVGSAFGPAGTLVGSFIGAGIGKFGARAVRGIGKLLRGKSTRTFRNIKREVSKVAKKIFPF